MHFRHLRPREKNPISIIESILLIIGIGICVFKGFNGIFKSNKKDSSSILVSTSSSIEENYLVKINSISNDLKSITLASGNEYICTFSLECESVSDNEGTFTIRLFVNKEKTDFEFKSANTTRYNIGDNYIDYYFTNSFSNNRSKLITFSIFFTPIEYCNVSDICSIILGENCIMAYGYNNENLSSTGGDDFFSEFDVKVINISNNLDDKYLLANEEYYCDYSILVEKMSNAHDEFSLRLFVDTTKASFNLEKCDTTRFETNDNYIDFHFLNNAKDIQISIILSIKENTIFESVCSLICLNNCFRKDKKCAVIFEDYDGDVLQCGNIDYGNYAKYDNVVPIRESNVQYDYSFNGWDIDPSTTKITGKTVFTVQYKSTLRSYTVTFKNYDGTVLQSSSVNYGSYATYSKSNPIKASDNQYTYTFNNWDKDLSTTKITGDSVFVAQYVSKLNISMLDLKVSDIIECGEYPQSLVTEDNIISALDKITLTDAQGYKSYNGEKYYQYSGTSYTDNNGNNVTSGYHYYKVEPIKWRYLGDNDGNALVVSEYILDCYNYGSLDDKYEDSAIRKWLNEDFLNIAFYNDDSFITSTNINFVASSGAGIEQFAYETVNDKIFLLSMDELTNTKYGFDQYLIKDNSRCSKTTEYARAIGCITTTSYNGCYMTRSTNYLFNNTKSLYYVDTNGIIKSSAFDNNSNTDYGIRPALVLLLNDN